MKSVRKILLSMVLALAGLFAFSEDWCIYLGSFKNKSNAEKRMSVLRANSIKTTISEYKDPKGTTYYRVVWDEHFDSLESVKLHKTMLSYLPIIKKEKINDIWFEKIVSAKSNIPESVPEKSTPAKSVVPETPAVEPEANVPEETDADDLESAQPEAESDEPEESLDSESDSPEADVVDEEETVEETEDAAEEPEPEPRKPTLMSLIDSETGLPLENAVLSIDDGNWEIEIDSEGKILMPGDIPDGEYPYTVTSMEDGRIIINGQLGLSDGLVVSDKRNAVVNNEEDSSEEIEDSIQDEIQDAIPEELEDTVEDEF